MQPEGMAPPKQRLPVEKRHLAEKPGMKKRYADYEEHNRRTFATTLGEARYSE
jgi:hypothetical protein